MGRQSMLHHINKILRILTDDGRELTGKLLVFDKHMNVVLSSVVEKRPLTNKMKKEGVDPTRHLGLILLRGEHVVSVAVVQEEGGNANVGRDVTGGHRDPNVEGKKGMGEEALNFSQAPKLKKAMAKKRPRDE